MKIGKKAVFALIFIFLLGIALPVSNARNADVERKSYISHGIIRINSDTELVNMASNEGWSGSGTASDPYVMENYEIDAHGAGAAIYIGNTTKYLHINNVHAFNASYYSIPYHPGGGIVLYNVQGTNIYWGNITQNYYGVYVRNGGWNSVFYSKVSRNTQYGIYIYSHFIDVVDTNISYNKGGIILYSSDQCRMEGNDIYMNGASYGVSIFGVSHSNKIKNNNIMFTSSSGVYLSGPGSNSFIPNTEITYNKIYNNTEGIKITYANATVIGNNTIFNNTNYGIHLYNFAKNTTVEINHIHNNLKGGVYSDPYSSTYVVEDSIIKFNNISFNGNGVYLGKYSNRNILHHNIFYNNSGYAITLRSSTEHNRIFNNSFYYNHGSTMTYDVSKIQAYDDGTNNYWNETDGGNYWRDWVSPDGDNNGIVDNPYTIDGSAGSKDYYPLTESYVVPELSALLMVVLLILPGLVAIWKKTR